MWSTPIFFLFFLPGTSAFEYPTVLELPDVFMNKMKEAYNTQDDILIRANFQPDFQFKTCFETFGRRRSIDAMKSFPFGSSYTKILNVTVLGDSHIKFILGLDASGQTNLQFVFVIDRFLLKLESVRFAQCPKPIFSRGKRSIDNAWNVSSKKSWKLQSKQLFLVIQRKSENLSMITLSSRDVEDLTTKVSNTIVNRKYLELSAETLNKISQISKEANFNFVIKSANWNNNEQIEYIATVSGDFPDDFEAQFIYCSHRQVLKSGSILSCRLLSLNSSDSLDY